MVDINLQMALVWTCPKCKKDNFLRGTRPSEEALKKAKEAEGYDPDEESPLDSVEEWLVTPKILVCQHCNAQYEARNSADDGVESAGSGEYYSPFEA